MTPRRVIILGLVAVVAVTLAVMLANRQAKTSIVNELLYPELRAQADSIEAIRIYTAGDTRAVEIVREGTQWKLTERNGYPAATTKVSTLVRALANAKLLEEKTADPSKYSALSLQDMSDAEAAGVRLELVGPAAPVNLIVGKDGPIAQSTYVRRVGEPTSWLISERIDVEAAPADWLDKRIVDISADRIQSARIAIAGQKPYTAAKSSRAAADFEVEPLPKGKELSSPGAASGFATALLSLSLEDVKPQSEVTGEEPDATAMFATFDGLTLELRGYVRDDDHYITLSPAYDAERAERFKLKTANDTNADEKSDRASEDAKTAGDSKPGVAAEVEAIASRVADWAYHIPEYKYDALFKPLDELLKK